MHLALAFPPKLVWPYSFPAKIGVAVESAIRFIFHEKFSTIWVFSSQDISQSKHLKERGHEIIQTEKYVIEIMITSDEEMEMEI